MMNCHSNEMMSFIFHLKSTPLTSSWWSMNGLMASMTPSGILSISSKMKRLWAQAETFPLIQSWRFS